MWGQPPSAVHGAKLRLPDYQQKRFPKLQNSSLGVECGKSSRRSHVETFMAHRLDISRRVLCRGRSKSAGRRSQGGEGRRVRVPHQLRALPRTGRSRRWPRPRSDSRTKEAHPLRRRHVPGHQQRHSRHRHARQRHERPGRRHDRHGNLADHHLHSQPGSEGAGQPWATLRTAKSFSTATQTARCATWSKAKVAGSVPI